MEEFDLRLFDYYREPVTAVRPDGTAAYMNDAAIRLFGGDRTGGPVPELAASGLLDGGADGAVGVVSVGGRDYTAARSSAGGYTVISVLDSRAERETSAGDGELLHALMTELSGRLGTMNVALGLMRQNLDRPGLEKAAAYSAHIDHEYHNITRLISHTLLCLEDGAEKLGEVTSFDLAELLRDLVSTTAFLVEKKGVSVKLTGDTEPLAFRGDASLIEQMVLNLLSNSLKSGADAVGIALKKTAEGAILTVSDNGSGVDRGVMDSVFSRYEEAHGLSDPKQGLGFGLTIVRKAARRHGGTVVMTAREGGGTSVSVTVKSLERDGLTLHTPVALRGRDMQLVLTELADVIDYTAYLPKTQD